MRPLLALTLPVLVATAACGSIEGSGTYGPQSESGTSADSGSSGTSGPGLDEEGAQGEMAAGTAEQDPGADSEANSESGPAMDASDDGVSGPGDGFREFRQRLADGQIPKPGTFDSAGFFSEHRTALPPASCGERLCVQPLLGVLGDPAHGTVSTVLQVGLTSALASTAPAVRPPLDITVVVDTSASMAREEKLSSVQTALSSLLSGLDHGDRFALVTFGNEATEQLPLSEVGLYREQAQGAIDNLRADGGTNLFAGLVTAYDTAARAYDIRRESRVILVNDGLPSVGTTSAPDILETGRSRTAGGIGFSAIGLGNEFSRDLLRNLARQADGKYYFVPHAEGVSAAFEQELAYTAAAVAFDISVEIETHGDYRVDQALGSAFWETTETRTSLEIPGVFESSWDPNKAGVSGSAEEGSALLLELSPEPLSLSKSQGEVATIHLSFREPGTDRRVTDRIDVTYPLPPGTYPNGGYFDPAGPATAQKSFLMLHLYKGIEGACATFHREGDVQAAAETLWALRTAARDFNDGPNDIRGDEDDAGYPDIWEDVQLLDDLLNVLAAHGYAVNRNRAEALDPWPVD